MEIIVLVISVLLGFWIKNIQLNNDKKKEVYESFLINLQFVHFGHSKLLIIPNDPYPYKNVHQAQIDLLKSYEQLKLWGNRKIIGNCSRLFYHFNLYKDEINETNNKIISDVRKQEILDLWYDDYMRIISSMRKDLLCFKFNSKLPRIDTISYDRSDHIEQVKKL